MKEATEGIERREESKSDDEKLGNGLEMMMGD